MPQTCISGKVLFLIFINNLKKKRTWILSIQNVETCTDQFIINQPRAVDRETSAHSTMLVVSPAEQWLFVCKFINGCVSW